ncbi:TPA: C40 family peptidase [Pseudomonas aeruginosa]|nr:C40 family peptidase [Pseudomonas aeruginosa]
MPMLKRLAPLVPMSFVLLLAACASHSPEPQVAKEPTAAKSSIDVERDAIAWQDVEDEGADNSSAGTPALASSILERAFELIGTPYRFGGTTAKGFDCSGFVGYLFREEAGIKLPRSTREMISMRAPSVPVQALQTGDLVFFATSGGRTVSHAGIYVGEGRFVHAPRTGGTVRLDSLQNSYWQRAYLDAKRVLVAPSPLARVP